MILGASSAGAFLPLSTLPNTGLATNATAEAFNGFLESWRPLDEKTPRHGSSKQSSSSQGEAEDRKNSISVVAAFVGDSPVSAPPTTSTEVVGGAPLAMSSQNVAGSVTRMASSSALLQKVDQRSPLVETKNVTYLTKESSRTELLDPMLRFEWRRTAVAGMWSADGLSITLRDVGFEDGDGERLLAAVRSLLSGQGDVLNRLTINGKNLFQR